VGICKTGGLVWKARLGEKRHFAAPPISDNNRKAPSWKRTYCFENKTRILKTRNNHGPGKLGTLCYRVWVRDSHKRLSRREGGSDVSQ
jgi:hypothetical protein